MAFKIGGQTPGDLGPQFRKKQIRPNATKGFRHAAPYDSRTGADSPLWPTQPNKIGKALEDIEPGDTDGVVVVRKQPHEGDEPTETSEKIHVHYDWNSGSKIVKDEEVALIEYPDEHIWRVFKGNPWAIKLIRCSDSKVVISANVFLGDDDGYLSDNKGKVIRLAETALLESACWTIDDETDCFPEICATVCTIQYSCIECNGCYKLTRCGTNYEITKIVASTSLCNLSFGDFVAEAVISTGSVVVLSDGFCYEVSHADTCVGVEDVTVVGIALSCESCVDECFLLEECYANPVIPRYYFKDAWPWKKNDVLKINGRCWIVIDDSDCSSFGTHFTGTAIKQSSCSSCGCYQFVSCYPHLYPTIIVKSAGDSDLEAMVGKVVQTDNFRCYTVSQYDADCTNADSVVVLTTYDKVLDDDCPACCLWRLAGCGGVADVWTWTDMRDYSGQIVLHNGLCYTVYGCTSHVEPALIEEVTVTQSWAVGSPCTDCSGTKLYHLTATCPICTDTPANFITDEALAAHVGKFIKYNSVCYSVSSASASAVKDLNSGFTWTGPFEDCTSCQTVTFQVVTNVYISGGALKVDKMDISVVNSCDPATATITTENC